ncbi:MAG: NADH-quinone oxidoreductase subunit N [Acidobacteria bacterium]|nr:NADH-quinone oxidoreductase subunit N [Acidobacteriota bacterium]MBI3656863.1 NADH-quinone oxidoreductase subunit N [Acidobacteriota bacterium]
MVDIADKTALLGDLIQNSALIKPEIMLIIWASFCLLVPKDTRRWVSIFALTGLAISGFSLYWTYGYQGSAFGGMLQLDAFGAFFKILFLTNAAVCIFMSRKYMDIEEEQSGEYYCLILFATVGMMFMAAAVDLITIFISLELMAICEFILVGYLRGNRRSNEAAMKFFLLGAFSTGLLLYGMSLLYGLSGSTSLEVIAKAMEAGAAKNPLMLVAMITLIAGLGFKIAAVPFHMWCPDAYEGAPTSITAFISVGPKAAAFAVLFRIFLSGLGPVATDPTYLRLLSVLAVLTMTWANLAALTQTNIKRLLAYSTISHAGYLLLGLIAGKDNGGVTAVAIYLFLYAFMNLGAFTIIVMVRRKGLVGDTIDDLKGLVTKNPGAAIMMTVFVASLAGLPPTAGFLAKYAIFSALIEAYFKTHYTYLVILAVIGVINSVVAFYYYWLIVRAMFLIEPTDDVKLTFSPGVVTALTVTFAVTLGILLYPEPLLNFARAASNSFLR